MKFLLRKSLYHRHYTDACIQFLQSICKHVRACIASSIKQMGVNSTKPSFGLNLAGSDSPKQLGCPRLLLNFYRTGILARQLS